MAATLAPRIGWTQRVAVAGVLALILLGLAWELRLAPLRPGGSWWALKVLPLALPLAGLLKRRLYTYRWLALLVWLSVPEVLVRGGDWSLVRPRQTYEALIGMDRMPEWLGG